MTEQQPYETVRSEGAFEVRRYPEHVVVETDVTGDFEDAGNRAFRYLFGYINGDNVARQSIAMTAPVVQTASGDSFTVAFVLPAGMTEASAPLPTRPEVRLRAVPPRLVAAARFTGRWTRSAYERQRAALLGGLADAGLTPVGETWFARFDPHGPRRVADPGTAARDTGPCYPGERPRRGASPAARRRRSGCPRIGARSDDPPDRKRR